MAKKSERQEATLPNPMIVSPNPTVRLHYGSDPLLGFHLSTASISIDPKSNSRGNQDLTTPVAVARAEFRDWCDSFRTRAGQKNQIHPLTLRFFTGDAIAFAYTLHGHRVTGRSGTAGWYRDRNGTFEVLHLAKEDYCHELSEGSSSAPAPVTFNVIDTSNLIDHVGALNLLIAVSPLIDANPSSVLYTEALVKQSNSDFDYVEQLLCGHLSAIALLLGLAPVSYWANTSVTCQWEDCLVDIVGPLSEGSTHKGQSCIRVVWARPLFSSQAKTAEANLQALHFDPAELANLLLNVFHQMYPVEHVSMLLSAASLDPNRISLISLPQYTRASFAALLRITQTRVETGDWEKTVGMVLGSLEQGSPIMLAKNYMQELYVQFHVLGVYSVDVLKHPCNTEPTFTVSTEQGLRDWKMMPPVVCVTLKVPRSKLRVFTDKPLNIGTVPMTCTIQSGSAHPSSTTAWYNTFAAVQLGFGKLSLSGTPDKGDFQVHIADDPQGWHGTSPLYVSFLAPSWMLLREPTSARVSFAIQATPLTTGKFARQLGIMLSILDTTLGDRNHVFISEHLPNQATRIAPLGFANDQLAKPKSIVEGVETTIKATLDRIGERILLLTARLDFISGSLRSTLRDGCQVTVQPNPTINSFTISLVNPGSSSSQEMTITFPIPVTTSSLKTRIARKSSYIELIADVVTDPASEPSPAFTCSHPPSSSRTVPIPYTLPYIPTPLSSLPIISFASPHSLERWLTPHVSLMLSRHERLLYENRPTHPTSQDQRSTLAAFKYGLFTLFMHFAGVDTPTSHNGPSPSSSRVFAISHPSEGGIQIVIFCSALRLDTANRVVVVDAAVLPLYDTFMPNDKSFINGLFQQSRDLGHIKVESADELRMWKTRLGGWVEKCRLGSWEHVPGKCEFVTEKKKALLLVQQGEQAMCDCGKGVFPANYITGDDGLEKVWNLLKEYCVRAAIYPVYASSLVEDLMPELAGREREMMQQVAAGGLGAFNDAGVNAGDDSPTNNCKTCGAEKKKDGQALNLCGKCRKVKYCSRECQRTGWKTHKRFCGSSSS
ncbi:hypothetical protein QBC35DRAFT_501567 [Podospora australis]|uniref:MYND-type domain-containing protein n=1 Tax=Podospora australis TaxID=1536484 RepID=A0AAN6WS06_9PEZI|nr:hypothetical protein QBC35DRAFT_501567 [Podospora australis]